MARVKMIAPEEADAAQAEVYDGVIRQWGRISNFSKVLAHQPAALAGWMLPNGAIRLDNVKGDPDYVKVRSSSSSRRRRSTRALPHVAQLRRSSAKSAYRKRRSRRRAAAVTRLRMRSMGGKGPRCAGPIP